MKVVAADGRFIRIRIAFTELGAVFNLEAVKYGAEGIWNVEPATWPTVCLCGLVDPMCVGPEHVCDDVDLDREAHQAD